MKTTNVYDYKESCCMLLKRPSFVTENLSILNSEIFDDVRDNDGTYCNKRIEKQNFNSADFSKIDFSQVIIQHCSFKNCNFEKSSFMEAVFIDCLFNNCQMENFYAKDLWIEECKFTGCSLIGSIFRNCAFKNSNFQYNNFNESKLESLFLDETFLISSELSDCTIKSLKLNHSSLAENNFFKTSLKNIDFTDTNISGITLSQNFSELRGATISPYQAGELISTLGIKVDYT